MTQQTLRLPATPFDDMAAAYDASFTQTALGTCLRAMVWQRLDLALAGCERVLDIGCGTGEDAIYLARRGHRILATDASASMLRIAEEKAKSAGCAKNIEFHCVPMERLRADLCNQLFDGVYSNFGAVNCAPALDDIVADTASLLNPDAPLVWVLMGRHVPWEWAWFTARGNWRKAIRRLRHDRVPWRDMTITYPTPAELAQSLNPYFAPVRRSALGFALPPTFASQWLENSPRLLAALTLIEHAAQRWQPLAAVADHYVFEARRRPERANA